MDCRFCGKKMKFSESSNQLAWLYVPGCNECSAKWDVIRPNVSEMAQQDVSQEEILAYIRENGLNIDNEMMTVVEYI